MERHTQQEQSGRERLQQPESQHTTPQGETGARQSDHDQSRHDSRRRRAAALRPILWRLHFIGGFLAGPVVISLALTGILFAWNPQIERLLYRDALTARTDRTVNPPRSLAEQVAAGRRQRPNWHLAAVIPASAAAATTGVVLLPERGEFAFGHGEDAVTVYVDPGSAQVTGEIAEAKRPAEWLRNLHSSWRLGPVARPLTELAASLFLTLLASALIVMVVAGYLMWWRRRPPDGLGVPPKLGSLRSVPIPLAGGFALLLVLLPTLGVSFVVFLVIERIVHALRRPAPALDASPRPAASCRRRAMLLWT